MPDSKVIGHIILESAPIEPLKSRIISDKGFNGKLVGEGVLQTAEEDNRNGRCYLHPDLYREINSPRTVELLSTGNLYAEDGHPMDTSMIRQQTILPTCRCARFLKLWMDGNNVMGQFVGSNTDLGRAFDMDLREGQLPSWSLRALGSLENVRGRNIVRNLKMITYDRVFYPSHPGAYTQRIIGENGLIAKPEETICGMTRDQINENGLLIPIVNDQVISYIKSESANLKSVLDQISCLYETVQLVDKRHVQLVTEAGDVLVVNIESHIQDEISNYCYNLHESMNKDEDNISVNIWGRKKK